MKYTVVWTPAALAELTQCWLDSDEKGVVTAGADAIDRMLASDPLHQRFEVFHDWGAAAAGTVGVDFRIDPGDRRVTITSVWTIGDELT